MPAIINSDDGVVSGSSGLKTTGGNDGITVFQQNGTESGRVSASRQWSLGPTSPVTPAGTLDVVRSVSNSAIEEVARISRIGGASSYGTSRAAALAFYDENNGTLVGALAGVRTAPAADYNGGVALYVNATGPNPATSVSSLTQALNITSGSVLQFNSGYGSVANAYACRAWVNFNGTGTVAIRASANVSSITDNNVGDYTVNFSNSMPDANYSWGFGGSNNANDTSNTSLVAITTTAYQVAGSLRILAKNLVGGGAQNNGDSTIVNISVFR